MSESTSQPSSSSVDPDLEVGHRVGEYVVDGKLGEGAFGIVFRAAHPVIGKVVAIKVLARKFSVDPEMVSRFVAEARAVNQIRHRHIIDIFSFGQLEDGRQYYVMEYLDGETLDALLERSGKLSLADALPILRGIARALDAAHAKGVAHRDLKAENVFLAMDADGGVFPKLLDFGIAKLMAPEESLKHKTRTGTPVGTPYYMSPEQCRGRDVDHRTDIYAFGVLSYLLLTGKYPHDADDYMSILMRQISDQPARPSSLAPELPAGVDDALAWLLQKDPAERPPNLRAGVAALEAAAEQAGISIATAVWDVQTGPSGKVDTRPPNIASASTTDLPAVKQPSSPWAPSAKPGSPPSTIEADALPRRGLLGALAILGGILLVAAAVVLLVVRPWEATTPTNDRPVKHVIVPVVTDAPAPEPQPVPIPVEAQTVIISIEGVPDGTEVLVGGMTAGAAPGPVQLPRDRSPMVMTFKVDGYFPASRTVTPDHDQKLVVTLKKKSISGTKRSPNKDDIIDIFEKKKR